MSSFAWPIRVYYESTDAGGVVYHAEYLKFFERARTEWLRNLGFEQTELRAQEGVIFVVRSMQIQYLQPARFNELLQVVSRLVEVGRSRFVFEQSLLRGEELLNQATVVVVCVSDGAFKPTALPARIRQQFEKALT
ncbi:MAG TPA: tol-pal system-associated acyl-CoA thioesterase [Methylophilaceae bacterium]|nr:tol-pal system-associated acyl-CoA thioesterase [Methylophilaceae bacterium]